MSASVGTLVNKRSTLVSSIVMGGLIIFALHLLDSFVVYSLLLKNPEIVLLQFIASGILGNAAFAGGLGTALLGVTIHLVISLVVAAVFLVAAGRLPVLHRNLILGGLLFGVVIFFVLNFVVIPLSAAPPVPIILPAVIWEVISHALTIGLTLALIARRNAAGSM